jgi:Putative peptidoglycan binding domain
MRLGTFALLSACVLGAALPAVAYTHARRGSTSAKTVTKHTVAKAKPTGPRAIEDDRATQLQAALIRSGYLTGTPSGHWDDQTQAAMQKLQADNGWQTKLVPDSRAIIKLGLGPNNDSAANTTGPLAGQPIPPAQQ